MHFTSSLFSSATTLEEVAKKLLNALQAWRVALTLPTAEWETTLAEAGNSLPPQYRPNLPIHLSICAHVAHMNHLLVIDDAFSHPLLTRHPAVAELGIAAYIGVPVMPDPGGHSMMVLCAQQIRPRTWHAEDLDVMNAGARHIRNLSSDLSAF